MTIRTLVLSQHPRTGGRYAKKAGLERWTYRVVHSARQVKGVRPTEVHILPDMAASPIRHSIFSALRYLKGLEYFYVDPADLPEPPDPRGELTDRQLEIAGRYDRLWTAARNAAEQRERVISLPPEEFARVMAELEGPAKPNEALAAAAKRVAAKPRAKAKAGQSKSISADEYFGS